MGYPVRENILHVLSDIVTSNIVYDIPHVIIDHSIAEPIEKFLREIYDE